MGKSSINGPFSMAMLVYQRVTLFNHHFSYPSPGDGAGTTGRGSEAPPEQVGAGPVGPGSHREQGQGERCTAATHPGGAEDSAGLCGAPWRDGGWVDGWRMVDFLGWRHVL